jgi:hypothetical protein
MKGRIKEARYRKRIKRRFRRTKARAERITWMVGMIKDSNLTIENFRPGKFSRC